MLSYQAVLFISKTQSDMMLFCPESGGHHLDYICHTLHPVNTKVEYGPTYRLWINPRWHFPAFVHDHIRWYRIGVGCWGVAHDGR